MIADTKTHGDIDTVQMEASRSLSDTIWSKARSSEGGDVSRNAKKDRARLPWAVASRGIKWCPYNEQSSVSRHDHKNQLQHTEDSDVVLSRSLTAKTSQGRRLGESRDPIHILCRPNLWPQKLFGE